MKRFTKTILPTLLSIFLGVFIITPLILANEKAIESLNWFQKLTKMFELIYKNIDIILALVFIIGGILYYIIMLNKAMNKKIKFLKNELYNHAQHIMYIKEVYQKTKGKGIETINPDLIDINELIGVIQPYPNKNLEKKINESNRNNK